MSGEFFFVGVSAICTNTAVAQIFSNHITSKHHYIFIYLTCPTAIIIPGHIAYHMYCRKRMLTEGRNELSYQRIDETAQAKEGLSNKQEIRPTSLVTAINQYSEPKHLAHCQIHLPSNTWTTSVMNACCNFAPISTSL